MPEQPMTVDQALQVASAVFARTSGNLQDHQTMQTALRVLSGLAGVPERTANPGSDREDSDE